MRALKASKITSKIENFPKITRARYLQNARNRAQKIVKTTILGRTLISIVVTKIRKGSKTVQ